MRWLLRVLHLLRLVRRVPAVGIEVLTMGPRDTLVIQTDQLLSAEGRARLKLSVAQLVDGDAIRRVVVMDPGTKLSVLRKVAR